MRRSTASRSSFSGLSLLPSSPARRSRLESAGLSGRETTGCSAHAVGQGGTVIRCSTRSTKVESCSGNAEQGLGAGEETSVTLVGRTNDGALWFSVGCAQRVNPDCGHFVRLEPDGSRSARFPYPDRWPLWISGRGFVTGRVEPERGYRGREGPPDRLVISDLSETGEATIAQDLELPPDLSRRRTGQSPSWTMNAAGDVAVVAAGTDRVSVAVWRANGELKWLRSFPRAVSRSVSRSEETRLGRPTVLVLNDESELLLGSWQIHADCSTDRDGWVLLGADGEVLADSLEPEGSGDMAQRNARSPRGGRPDRFPSRSLRARRATSATFPKQSSTLGAGRKKRARNEAAALTAERSTLRMDRAPALR